MESEISPSLVSFRTLLTENKLDAYVIPRTDPHDVYFSHEFLSKNIHRVKSYQHAMKDSSSFQVLVDQMVLLLSHHPVL